MRQEKKFWEEEFKASLKSSFVDRKINYIIVDGSDLKNKSLIDATQYAIDQGWLDRGWACPGRSTDEDEIWGDQHIVCTYRLTYEGKRYLGIN